MRPVDLRPLHGKLYGCALVASDDLVRQARNEADSSNADFMLLVEKPPEAVQLSGLEQPVGIWTRDYIAA